MAANSRVNSGGGSAAARMYLRPRDLQRASDEEAHVGRARPSVERGADDDRRRRLRHERHCVERADRASSRGRSCDCRACARGRNRRAPDRAWPPARRDRRGRRRARSSRPVRVGAVPSHSAAKTPASGSASGAPAAMVVVVERAVGVVVGRRAASAASRRRSSSLMVPATARSSRKRRPPSRERRCARRCWPSRAATARAAARLANIARCWPRATSSCGGSSPYRSSKRLAQRAPRGIGLQRFFERDQRRPWRRAADRGIHRGASTSSRAPRAASASPAAGAAARASEAAPPRRRAVLHQHRRQAGQRLVLQRIELQRLLQPLARLGLFCPARRRARPPRAAAWPARPACVALQQPRRRQLPPLRCCPPARCRLSGLSSSASDAVSPAAATACS